MIPLLHDFSDERVLVFGGGSVGARKARRFDREATVVVVSPSFGDTDFGDARLVRAAVEPPEVDDWLDRVAPALVVAATDDESVNGAIESAARARSILVNRADRAGPREAGSVVVPATVHDDPVVVAIATEGTAPALSRYLREQFEEPLAGAGEMARLLAAVRTDLERQGVDPERRREILRAVVRSVSVWTALRSGGVNRQIVQADVVSRALDAKREPGEAIELGGERR